MGDIARHRNIYFEIRNAIPPRVLDAAGITRKDLTYLEFGNFMTDVSQFRDPVWYILAKRTIWQERVLGGTSEITTPVRLALAALGSAGALLAHKYNQPEAAAGSAAAGVISALALSPDLLADMLKLDDWVDKMLGKPLIGPKGRRRTDEEYGYVGQFFQHFIEGITQMLFSDGATERVTGVWDQIESLSETRVAEIYKKLFTQYFPHEHTDQPPYVWDASRRPQVKKWYGKSRRQKTATRDAGIITAVDNAYIPYLADGLSALEAEWRGFKSSDTDARQLGLARLGKILHGVEDWFFHSNVVELNRLVRHKPPRGETEDEEDFLERFVQEALKDEESYRLGDDSRRDPRPTRAERQVEFRRRLYRRLRFPVYDPGTRAASGGTPSNKPSTISLELAYPAFPSQQDTAHTLLGALENLESKFHGSGGASTQTLPPGFFCAIDKFVSETPRGRALYREKARLRGIAVPANVQTSQDVIRFASTVNRDRAQLVAYDVLREWMPLILTLILEDERDRIADNVPADLWPLAHGANPPKQEKADAEIDEQLKRHAKALEPVLNANGVRESGYKQGMRMLKDCKMIGARSRAALDRAFEIDGQSQKENPYAPGAGGILMIFAIRLHKARNKTVRQITALNQAGTIFDKITDNGADDEIVGSHSLMSKDTVDSSPFFDDAHVMASVASQAVLHIFLQEIASPANETVLDWMKILRYLIRYPPVSPEWERQVVAHFKATKEIPKFADIPNLGRLAQGARLAPKAVAQRRAEMQKRGIDATGLEEEYIRLERVVANYRQA
ncbi:MAG: hypothetical protein GY947_13025 [Rhodobacteraceae bacterium]|nr:hypothetical protein [Paracoccaceae bacterium]